MTYLSKISNSKSSVIDQCLLKFHYRYNERFPGNPTNEEPLNYGSYIHKIFEDGVNLTNAEDLHRIATTLKEEYKVTPKREKDTAKCINNFLRFNEQLKGENVACELHQVIELEPGIEFEFIIDRVIKGEDGGYLIIDYKTSKREKNKVELYGDPQLQGYAYAIHTLFKVPIGKITCAHYYPLTNNLVSVRYPSSAIYQWKKNQVQKVWRIRKMKKTDFVPMENEFCNWCQYKDGLCPKFNPPQIVNECILKQKQMIKEQKEKK